MRYLIMEAQLGYAIAMDEQGIFKKVVNRNYEIGQVVEHIISFEEEDEKKKKRKWRQQVTTLAAAACFCLVMLGAYQQYMIPYGTVTMQINPEVMLSVNENDYVIDVDGINEDGIDLIEDYNYRFKKLEEVSDELADRAIAQGFLEDGGEIVLDVESEHEAWITETEQKLVIELTEHLEEKVEIKTRAQKEEEFREENRIVIDTNDDEEESAPVSAPSDTSNYGDSNYDNNSNYGTSNYGTSNYGASNYDSSDDDD